MRQATSIVSVAGLEIYLICTQQKMPTAQWQQKTSVKHATQQQQNSLYLLLGTVYKKPTARL